MAVCSLSESFQDLIQRYFIQLTSGCGRKGDCDNHLCATGSGQPVPPNEAAAKALILARERARLCVPVKLPSSNSKTQLSDLSRNHVSGHNANSVVRPSPLGGSERGGAGGTPLQAGSNTSNHRLPSELPFTDPLPSSAASVSVVPEEEPMDTGNPPPPPPPPSSSSSSSHVRSSAAETAATKEGSNSPITKAVSALYELTKKPVTSPKRHDESECVSQQESEFTGLWCMHTHVCSTV